MRYDFTTILNRRGRDAIAVDAVGAPGSGYPAPRDGFDIIPMWIAYCLIVKETLLLIGRILIWISVALTILSGVRYVWLNRAYLKDDK